MTPKQHFLNFLSSRILGVHARGAAALIIVLTIGAVALIMAGSSAKLGIGEMRQGSTYEVGSRAFSVADGCMEEALGRLRKDASYGLSGAVYLSVLGGSCTIEVADIGSAPEKRRITSAGTLGNSEKTIEAEATITDTITVNSWLEK